MIDIMSLLLVYWLVYAALQDLHVLTHSFATQRSADLRADAAHRRYDRREQLKARQVARAQPRSDDRRDARGRRHGDGALARRGQGGRRVAQVARQSGERRRSDRKSVV